MQSSAVTDYCPNDRPFSRADAPPSPGCDPGFSVAFPNSNDLHAPLSGGNVGTFAILLTCLSRSSWVTGRCALTRKISVLAAFSSPALSDPGGLHCRIGDWSFASASLERPGQGCSRAADNLGEFRRRNRVRASALVSVNTPDYASYRFHLLRNAKEKPPRHRAA